MANAGKINWRRVVAGGLLAGLILNILEGTAGHVIVGNQMAEEMKALGRVMQPTAGALAFFVSMGFALGLVSIWLYAAIRPRFGPGPRTAIYAAVIVWFLAALIPHLLNGFLGLFSMELELKFSAMLLVWHLVATLAGAWLYQEETAVGAVTG